MVCQRRVNVSTSPYMGGYGTPKLARVGCGKKSTRPVIENVYGYNRRRHGVGSSLVCYVLDRGQDVEMRGGLCCQGPLMLSARRDQEEGSLQRRVCCGAGRQQHNFEQEIESKEKSNGRGIDPSFCVMSEDGAWRVRPLDSSHDAEVRQIVSMQVEGFHERNPVPVLDTFFKAQFQAEVLSEMRRKIKFNPEDRFVCLVVESTDPARKRGVVGVVEVSYIDEKEVLRSLQPDVPGVVYIASMTVDPSCRRQGIAKTLLSAAIEVAREWQEDQCVLHVYQDNKPAIELYESQGFSTIFMDAPWLAKLAVRPRFLMRREVTG